MTDDRIQTRPAKAPGAMARVGARIKDRLGKRVLVRTTPTTYSVCVRQGSVTLSDAFAIEFVAGPPRGIDIWRPPPTPTSVLVSYLRAESGSGKTTLLRQLVKALGRPGGAQLPIDTTPNVFSSEELAVAHIPQGAPAVKHWRIGDLVPRDSDFYAALLPGKPLREHANDRLGGLSGGERLRLYVSSALESLRRRPASASFMLLDEAFDPLGAADLQLAVADVARVWAQTATRPLHVLAITHHRDVATTTDALLTLKVRRRNPTLLEVDLVLEQASS